MTEDITIDHSRAVVNARIIHQGPVQEPLITLAFTKACILPLNYSIVYYPCEVSEEWIIKYYLYS